MLGSVFRYVFVVPLVHVSCAEQTSAREAQLRISTVAPLQPSAPLLNPALQLLTSMLNPVLDGESDILRALSRQGYRLRHVQHPKSELDWGVASLATDLRDGMRLCRLADVLLQTAGPQAPAVSALVATCRFPASVRPARLHNVSLALEAAVRAGLRLPDKADPAHASAASPRAGVHPAAPCIVDGDRAWTLDLLWRLWLRFHLPRALRGGADLVDEVRLLDRRGADEQAPPIPERLAGEAGPAAGLVKLLLRWATLCALGQDGDGAQCVRSSSTTVTTTMCPWAEQGAIGSCFGDGSLFCRILAHYGLLSSRSEVYTPDRGALAELTGTRDAAQMSWALACREDGWAAAHRAGVARNHRLAASALAPLAGDPSAAAARALLEVCGTSAAAHGADDRTALLALCALCAALMAVGREGRAALAIQRAWRRARAATAAGDVDYPGRPGYARRHLRSWIAAATVVQRAWRARRDRAELQRALARLRRGARAVARLQAVWRGRGDRSSFLAQRAAALTVQRVWRGRQARREVHDTILVPRLLETARRRAAALAAQRWAAARVIIGVWLWNVLENTWIDWEEFLEGWEDVYYLYIFHSHR